MNLIFSAAIGVLFGSGILLMLKPDLFRVVVGLILVSNAANLTVMASGMTRGQAPIKPLTGSEPVADPLVQAMTLTAIVIGFAVTAVLLALAIGLYRARGSVDLEDLSRATAQQAAEEEAQLASLDTEREMEEPMDREPVPQEVGPS